MCRDSIRHDYGTQHKVWGALGAAVPVGAGSLASQLGLSSCVVYRALLYAALAQLSNVMVVFDAPAHPEVVQN